ncbi:MAG: hypothetical protein H6738_05655 [Alphaproteobacteria bacterium]|nr:hypothetical protein [Alphaproteobacteria bacterium]MCB9696254.1 hypothetical protein [Alphaproteobacteria bacterium]
MNRTREAVAWWALALVFHLVYGAFVLPANDWDPAYYRSVAAHVVNGDGAVDGALWNLLWLPPELPMVANLHWMPLPSLILVPGMWLFPRGDLLVTSALAACWAPMAWRFAELFGLDLVRRRWAALLGLTGLVNMSWCSTADSYALYGTLGGLAVLAAARERAGGCALLAAVAALTRNDGFLFAFALALAFRGLPALGVAASGPLAAAAWHLRNAWIVGPDYARMRALTADVVDVENLSDLVLANATPLSLLDRLSFLVHALPQLAIIWIAATPACALWWFGRRERWMRSVWAYYLLMPLVVVFLAPGVGLSGSVARSSCALVAVVAAATVGGISALAAWGHRVRDLHPAFVATMASLVSLTVPLGFGLLGLFATPLLSADTCDVLAPVPEGAPVFSTYPLLMEEVCGRSGVVVLRDMDPAVAQDLARRYDVQWIVVSAGTGTPVAVRPQDVPRLLPGWERSSDRLYHAPEAVPAE